MINWNKLTREDRNTLRKAYTESKFNSWKISLLEDLFGKTNLLSPAENESPSEGKPRSFYKTQTFLNPENSPSTGSVVCYDGEYDYDDGRDRYAFLEVSDCHQKVRLHKCNGDTIGDFLLKLKTLRGEIDNFIHYLENGESF